jgi:hypothetical protein
MLTFNPHMEKLLHGSELLFIADEANAVAGLKNSA